MTFDEIFCNFMYVFLTIMFLKLIYNLFIKKPDFSYNTKYKRQYLSRAHRGFQCWDNNVYY